MLPCFAQKIVWSKTSAIVIKAVVLSHLVLKIVDMCSSGVVLLNNFFKMLGLTLNKEIEFTVFTALSLSLCKKPIFYSCL